MILSEKFYSDNNVISVGKKLLGKTLCTSFEGILTSGIITETEAYAGETDRASHAYGGRRTARTGIMYRVGGTAYVYLCYGIHSLFNVVTSPEGIPHAILIRSIKPVDGIEAMALRANKAIISEKQGTGPGNVSRLLGIHYRHSGLLLCSNHELHPLEDAIWIEDRGILVPEDRIESGPRIGVDYAREDALLPYRFKVKNGTL